MRWITPISLFIGLSAFSQSITVDDTSYSASDLADLLMDNACVQVFNVSASSNQAVAYFNDNGGAFPFSEGVIIRTGVAGFSAGSYTGLNMTSQLNSNSDAFLSQLNASTGQSTTITDVAFLEFEFVPLSANFNFDFLFASNEYGQWQCLSSDVFAFLLTDLTTNTTINLAFVPGTSQPISINNIKDNAYNPTCPSANPAFFDSYEVNNPNSTINMRGYTVVMNVQSGIVPGNPYRIRMVIGDSRDAQYDSAIFLKAGSFNVDLNLGPDREICDGDEFVLNTNLDPSVYFHVWRLNGNILPGQNGNTLTANQSGVYRVSITKNGSGCNIVDEIVFSSLQVQSSSDLVECYDSNGSYSYDLTVNDEAALGINNNIYDLTYYASMADITAQNPIPTSSLTSYSSPGNQSIYIKITNKNTGNTCNAVYTFDLLINEQIPAQNTTLLEICEGSGSTVDLTQQNSEIITSGPTGDYDFIFFETFQNANNETNPITNPSAYPIPTSTAPFSVWVRVQDAQMPECFVVIQLTVITNPLPTVDSLPDVIVCTEYVLPAIANGDYYTGPNGTGTMLSAGDIIDDPAIIYIFNGPDTNGCTNQSDFEVTIIEDYGNGVDDTHCGSFTVPNPPAGDFYTAPNGPNGTGTVVVPGTVFNSSVTLYYYVELNGVFCRDQQINITVFPLPPVDSLNDVVTCNQHVLPNLTAGGYYTQPGGGGSQLNAGDAITTSQTIYIFSDDGTCTNQTDFTVTILPNFTDLNACGSYTLPQINVGGYFTQASGQGQQIPGGTVITTTQTIYYYAQTTTTPNCTDNLSFTITVVPIPPVDSLNDVLACEDVDYTLPALVDGEYFTAPSRGGTQLFPGDVIASTATIYINNLVNGCDNETSFLVEVRPIPIVPNFTDIYVCEPFMLPPLENGFYYTESGGNGTMLQEGHVVDSTQIIYIYNDYDDLVTCNNEVFFTVYVQRVEVGEYDDVSACDYYVLPNLPVGDYFSQTGGEGIPLFAGDTIKADTELFVYGENGVRFPCKDEDGFMVNISETPELPVFGDIENCGPYLLPELSQTDYDVGYYYESGGKSPIPSNESLFSEPGNHTIYVYATAKDNPDCSDEEEFELTVYPLPELEIEGGTLCFDPKTGEIISPVNLESGLDPAEFTVNWYLDGKQVHSGPEFSPTQAGTYTVKTVKLAPETGGDCNYIPATVYVYESAQPTVKAYVTEPFAEVANITVEVVDGVGEYEFQLDDRGFGPENVFHNVESGTHIIRVRGINGECGEVVLEVEVFHYPKFFTPNNDGHNDRWNIPDLNNHPETIIFIFDKYGKLLASIKPTKPGWDGVYNGKPMTSDDYWFKVKFIEKLPGGSERSRVFVANFSLLRRTGGF